VPAASLDAVQHAIADSERAHSGQIRFAIEPALDLGELLRGVTPRSRAIDVFSELRVWDTEHNNGVLIYLLLADRDFEIVADRGIHAHVGADGWEMIAREMEVAFRGGDFLGGITRGIASITQHLSRHFPPRGGINELPDRPVVL
jgi:uncharacterized membrane protein